MQHLILISTFCFCSLLASAQNVNLATMVDTFPFINHDNNHIKCCDTLAMNHFIAQLDNCVTTDTSLVSIVHIGDSHLQADFFTSQVRNCFNYYFGVNNPSRGFMFPYAMANTNNPFNYKVDWKGEWTASRALNKKHDTLGLSAISVTTTDSVAVVNLKLLNLDTMFHYCGSQLQLYVDCSPKCYRHSVVYPNVIGMEIDSLSNCVTWYFEQPTDSVSLKIVKTSAQQSKFTIYGMALTNNKAIEYHTIGLNGATVATYLKCHNFERHLQSLAPNLVVVSLGTNDSYTTRFDSIAFEKQLTILIERIRSAANGASILLTTPNANKLQKNTFNYNVVAASRSIERIAEQQKCAVWNFNALMGNAENIDLWLSAQLLRQDCVHLTRKGYELQGNMFFRAIIALYQRYVIQNYKLLNPEKSNCQ